MTPGLFGTEAGLCVTQKREASAAVRFPIVSTFRLFSDRFAADSGFHFYRTGSPGTSSSSSRQSMRKRVSCGIRCACVTVFHSRTLQHHANTTQNTTQTPRKTPRDICSCHVTQLPRVMTPGHMTRGHRFEIAHLLR